MDGRIKCRSALTQRGSTLKGRICNLPKNVVLKLLWPQSRFFLSDLVIIQYAPLIMTTNDMTSRLLWPIWYGPEFLHLKFSVSYDQISDNMTNIFSTSLITVLYFFPPHAYNFAFSTCVFLCACMPRVRSVPICYFNQTLLKLLFTLLCSATACTYCYILYLVLLSLVLLQYCALFYCQRHPVTSVKRWIWRYLDFLWLTASIQARLWRLWFLRPFAYYDQNGLVPRSY